MAKYKKVTEKEVLSVFIQFSASIANDTGIYPVNTVARQLGTSQYQVRKHVKQLVEKGFIERATLAYQDYDTGHIVSINGFSATEKTRQTDEFKLERENEERQFKKANDVIENGWETATGQRIPINFIDRDYLINIICYLKATNELDSNAEIIAIMERELQRREVRNDKLKPCPFCGGKARKKGAKYNTLGVYGGKNTEKTWHGIYCTECRIGQPSRVYENRNDAINAWNRRA